MKRAVVCLAFATHACFAMVIDPVDPAFGIAVADFPAPGVYLAGLAPVPGGRIAVLAVQETAPGCHAATMLMYAADGSLDPSFGQEGRTPPSVLDLPPCAGAAGLAVAPDGTLYFLSNGTAAAAPRVHKLRADGRVKVAFGSGASAAVPGLDAIAEPVLQILADGTIAIGGTARPAAAAPWGLAVARLHADGSPDASYGTEGLAFAVPPNRPIHAHPGGGMAVNADGSTLVAGNIFEDDAGARIYTDATVARFDPRGRLDVAYGVGGFAIPLPDASTYVRSLAVRDGVAYLAGVLNRDTRFAFVAKVDAGGRADLRYGVAGVAGTDSFRETGHEPAVAVDRAHRIYYVTTSRYSSPRVTRLTADGIPDADFGLDGSAYVAAQGWAFPGRAQLQLDEHDRLVVAGDLASDPGADHHALAVSRLRHDGGRREAIAGGTAVIYYNAALGHYFMTADPAEQARLDNGVTAGWQRTGEDFRVVLSRLPDAELSPVCRYYGRPEAHLDSHFFSAAPDECAAVAQMFPASWMLETSQAFQVHLPHRTTGACPRGSLKVLRAFNGRADANHYYGWLAAAPAGWVYEGYGPGPYPAALCAPLL